MLFDLDDTLFDHHHCARTALGMLHGRHDCFRSLEFAAFEQAHGRYLEELHEAVLEGRLDLDAARHERFRRLYAHAGVTADQETVGAAASAYRQAYMAARTAVAGAEALLAQVRAHARVGVVSNNLRDERRRSFATVDSTALLTCSWSQRRLALQNLILEIFRVALERLECSADEAVMVGDSWAADIVGASGLGIRAVWFNRGRRPAPEPELLIQEIAAFEPVEDAIEVILGSRSPGGPGSS